MIELSITGASQDKVIVNITWWKRRTRLEKKLIIGVVFIAGVTFSFLLDAALYSRKTPKVCKSVQCITASSEILNLIDETVDPCNDFFKFACGKLSERAHHEDVPTKSNRYQVKKQLINILSEPVNKNDNPLLNYQKQLFLACVNEAKNGTSLKVLKSMLTDLGGWPVLIGEEWNEKNFKWMETLERLKNMGLYHQMFLQVNLEVPT